VTLLDTERHARTQRRSVFALAVALALSVAGPGTAGAAAPNPPTPGPATPPSTPPAAPRTPTIQRIRCVRDCPSTSTARAGARIRVAGSGLKVVRRVVFNGNAGQADDVTVRARPRSDRSVIVAVPDTAVSGPLSAVAARATVRSRPSRPLTIVSDADPGGEESPSSNPSDGTHVFPVAGSHTFGGAGGRFGAPRGGRLHEGQDISASCGTRLVAAASGVVKINRFQSLAGNYLVIDGADYDYAYLHLASPSPLQVGQTVSAGQDIGVVGATGDAQGCHLHFELWTGGYRSGGTAVDPLPLLQTWDRR